MYTGGLLTTRERATTFDAFLAPPQWDEPAHSRTAIEALHEEVEEDEDGSYARSSAALTDQSNFTSSSSSSSSNAIPTPNSNVVAYSMPTPSSTSTSTSTPSPSRSLSASPAASFLSSFFSPAPSSAPKPDDEGQVIAGYTLGSIIGYGSTSIIRRASSSSSGAQAAVKIVRRSDLVKAGNAPQARRKLQHEAAVWSALSHEHILPLFTAVHTTYADYFFTLYCPAGSLFDILKRDGNPALPQDDAGMMFRQIVRGMRYLHEVANYVHRDLKLENVLVDEMGVCKIADFGMSRKIGSVEEENEDDEDSLQRDDHSNFHAHNHNAPILRAQTLNVASANRRHAHAHPHLNHLLHPHRHSPSPSSRHHRNSTSTSTAEPPRVKFQPGSLPYAAPELLLPQTSEVLQPHPSQDIWALGVMLYALLTGRLPFWDGFEPRLQMKILNGTYDLPQGIGRGAERILQGCLDRNVPNRWTIAMVDEVAWGVGWGAEGDDARPSGMGVDAHEIAVGCDTLPPSRASRSSASRSRSQSRPGHEWQHPDESKSKPSVDAASRRSTSRAKRSLSRAPVLTDKSSSSRSVSRSISRHPRTSSPSSASSPTTEPYTPSSAVSSGGPYSAFFDESALDDGSASPSCASPVQRGRGRRKFHHSCSHSHSHSHSDSHSASHSHSNSRCHSHSHSHSRSPSPSVVPSTPQDALLVASPTDMDLENPDHDELRLDDRDGVDHEAAAAAAARRGRPAIRSSDTERPQGYEGAGGKGGVGALDFVNAWRRSRSRSHDLPHNLGHDHDHETDPSYSPIRLTHTHAPAKPKPRISSSAFLGLGQPDVEDVDHYEHNYGGHATSATSNSGLSWRQRPLRSSSPPTSARVQQKLGLGLGIGGIGVGKAGTPLEPFLSPANVSASSSTTNLGLRSRSGCR